jgi:hypothetical protein
MKRLIYVVFLTLIVLIGCNQESSNNQLLLKFEEVNASSLGEAITYFEKNIESFSESEKKDYANEIVLTLDDKVKNLINTISIFKNYNYQFDSSNQKLSIPKSLENELGKVLPNDIIDLAMGYYISDGSQIDENGISYVLKYDLVQGVEKALELTSLEQEKIDGLRMMLSIPNVYYHKLDEPFNSFEATEKYAKVSINETTQLDLFLNENVWKTTVYLPLEVVYKDIDNSNSQEFDNSINDKEPLIEVKEENGIETYWSYGPNQEVYFDLDSDNNIEKIVFDTKNNELRVNDNHIVNLDESIIKTNFLILRYYDHYDAEMFLIGLEKRDANDDVVKTNLYALIKPDGQKWFGSVGEIRGSIQLPHEVNLESKIDFDTKAIIIYGEGINAPVKLNVFNNDEVIGRSLFTYYSTYKQFVDNSNQYDNDYIINFEGTLKNPIMVYKSKEEMNGEEIKKNTKIKFLTTDNDRWTYILCENGTSGYTIIQDIVLE